MIIDGNFTDYKRYFYSSCQNNIANCLWTLKIVSIHDFLVKFYIVGVGINMRFIMEP